MSMYQPLPCVLTTAFLATSMNACHSVSAWAASALPQPASGCTRLGSSLRRDKCEMITCGYRPKRAKYRACMVRTSSCVLASVTVVADPPQALAVRSGIDDGVSDPPCGAERITGVLPAMYSP